MAEEFRSLFGLSVVHILLNKQTIKFIYAKRKLQNVEFTQSSFNLEITQLTFICSIQMIEILVNDVVVLLLFLTLNIIRTFFYCLYC